jgi:hypothetical protein
LQPVSQPTHYFGRLVLRVEMMHFESLTCLLRMHARRHSGSISTTVTAAFPDGSLEP